MSLILQPAIATAQTVMNYEIVQLSGQSDLSMTCTEAFLMKQDAGQRPTQMGMSANLFFFTPLM